MIDGRHMTGLVLPQQHIGVIWAEWEKIGKPMPFAVVQGGDPGVPMIGGMPIPADVDEGSFLGTLYGEPVEVVKCETIDLDVTATAEVVIEGHLSRSPVTSSRPVRRIPRLRASGDLSGAGIHDRGDHLPRQPDLAGDFHGPPAR